MPSVRKTAGPTSLQLSASPSSSSRASWPGERRWLVCRVGLKKGKGLVHAAPRRPSVTLAVWIDLVRVCPRFPGSRQALRAWRVALVTLWAALGGLGGVVQTANGLAHGFASVVLQPGRCRHGHGSVEA
jgi:hypothetical protein